MIKKTYDVVLVGAGVAGLATAYFLLNQKAQRVLILEQEEALGGHSSGRNAGMIRQVLSDPVLASLAHEGRELLYHHFGRQVPSAWQPNGSLLISKKGAISTLDQIQRISKLAGIFSKKITQKNAQKKVSALAGAQFDAALFCPSDALIDLERLMQFFKKHLQSMKAQLAMGQSVTGIEKSKGLFSIQLKNQIVQAPVLVNGAGAWASMLGKMAQAEAIPFTAYRRHLFESDTDRENRQAWPFVWDIGLDFYFRPLQKGLLLSPCDKEPMSEKYMSQRKEEIGREAEKKLIDKMNTFSPYFKKLRLKTAKSGLRTLTPDGRFVVGEDVSVKGFYWVAGLGGHGVTTCLSVGRLASRLILNQPVNGTIAKAISCRRFKVGESK